MRKLIAILAALAIFAAPSAALAGKKPKPYTESASVLTGHTVLNSASGGVVALTAQEFLARCDVPATQGVDAYVIAVPAEYQKIEASLEATGTSPNGLPYDIDAYTYDSSCQMNSTQNAAGTDLTGFLFKGTAWILIHNYEPGPLDIEVTIKP